MEKEKEKTLRAILQKLEESNPNLKFELILKDGVSPGGWVTMEHGEERVLVYSTAVMSESVVFCGTPDGNGGYFFPRAL